jgi:hypothetical protein
VNPSYFFSVAAVLWADFWVSFMPVSSPSTLDG